MHIATFCAICDMFNRQNWACCLKGMLTLIYLDLLNSISKSPFKNSHFKLILGADCFLVLQGQPGKTGARGPMGEPGPKVHDSIIQITRLALTKNSLLPKWSPSWISLVGFILNLLLLTRTRTRNPHFRASRFYLHIGCNSVLICKTRPNRQLQMDR